MTFLALWPTVCCDRNFFGHLVEIRGDKYADTIDKESPDVFVVISIYEEVQCTCVCTSAV